MLTEPDMQARYVAATLGVIETELRKLDMPASNRQALVTLVTGAARVATRLADELEQPTHPDCDSFLCSPALAADRGNFLAFKR